MSDLHQSREKFSGSRGASRAPRMLSCSNFLAVGACLTCFAILQNLKVGWQVCSGNVSIDHLLPYSNIGNVRRDTRRMKGLKLCMSPLASTVMTFFTLSRELNRSTSLHPGHCIADLEPGPRDSHLTSCHVWSCHEVCCTAGLNGPSMCTQPPACAQAPADLSHKPAALCMRVCHASSP